MFILIEPTRGVDVGARAEIYRRLEALARTGKADPGGLLRPARGAGLADRILVVVRDGRIAAETTARGGRRGRTEPDGPGGPHERAATRPRCGRARPLRGHWPRPSGAPCHAGRPAIVVFIALRRPSPPFGTPGNAANIAKQTAVGPDARARRRRCVVLVGGIDLSVGSVVLPPRPSRAACWPAALLPALAILARGRRRGRGRRWSTRC